MLTFRLKVNLNKLMSSHEGKLSSVHILLLTLAYYYLFILMHNADVWSQCIQMYACMRLYSCTIIINNMEWSWIECSVSKERSRHQLTSPRSHNCHSSIIKLELDCNSLPELPFLAIEVRQMNKTTIGETLVNDVLLTSQVMMYNMYIKNKRV